MFGSADCSPFTFAQHTAVKPVVLEEALGEAESLKDGETRYARPWRPVKPLLIMLLVGQICVRQRAQRNSEVCPPERKVGEKGPPG
jgi:hypothetical protein